MSDTHISDDRIKLLNDVPAGKGQYVLYWMQQSQREDRNHALEFAIQRANERGVRLLVCFGLMHDYPEANSRHYRFLLEGLKVTAEALAMRGICFVLQWGDPHQVAIDLAGDAVEVVCDRGYLRHQKAWRRSLTDAVECPVWQVEADVVVPVEVASKKAEFAARTIRSKIHKQLDRFLIDLRRTPLTKDSLNLRVEGEDISDVDKLMRGLSFEPDVPPVSEEFPGGTKAALAKLRSFLKEDFQHYSEGRALVPEAHVSMMSPYLHFGQISPIRVALEADSVDGLQQEKKDFLEELIVRRELAQNFVEYQRDYDSYQSLPDWAKETLGKHRDDEREHHYTAEELEFSKTHDDAWNAAMTEMRLRGYLHNRMRMYWGKKILEWTNTPEFAYQTALQLNNKYFLDGRDANSFANISWVFGLHDRPFQERPIFGKVRYMNAEGLKRKFDVDAYIQQVAELER